MRVLNLVLLLGFLLQIPDMTHHVPTDLSLIDNANPSPESPPHTWGGGRRWGQPVAKLWAILISEQIIYRVDLAGNTQAILTLAPEQRITDFQDGIITLITGEEIDLNAEPPRIISVPPLNYPELLHEALDTPYTPISGIRGIELPAGDFAAWEGRLYIMSGEADTYTNLYAVQVGSLIQLTDVIGLFPDAVPPYLAASVEFISVRPMQPGLLYRARLRDSTGNEFNALYLYDLATGVSIAIPYFGKKPVWSPDGIALAGSRLHQAEAEPLLYHLWISNLETGIEQEIAPACNPQWSPDGAWLAYDHHDNPFWQNYMDCFANGQVAAVNLETGEKVLLSANLSGAAQLIGWLAE